VAGAALATADFASADLVAFFGGLVGTGLLLASLLLLLLLLSLLDFAAAALVAFFDGLVGTGLPLDFAAADLVAFFVGLVGTGMLLALLLLQSSLLFSLLLVLLLLKLVADLTGGAWEAALNCGEEFCELCVCTSGRSNCWPFMLMLSSSCADPLPLCCRSEPSSSCADPLPLCCRSEPSACRTAEVKWKEQSTTWGAGG